MYRKMIQPDRTKAHNKIQIAGHIFNSNTPRPSQGHATLISNGFDRSIYKASDGKTTEWNFRKHDDEGAWGTREHHARKEFWDRHEAECHTGMADEFKDTSLVPIFCDIDRALTDFTSSLQSL
jgi:hypothetical protein